MNNKTIRPGIIIRVTGIVLVSFILVYIALETWFWLVACWIGVFFILQVIELIRYTERSRAELIHFLTAISQDDFTSAYSVAQTSKRYTELSRVLAIIQGTFVKLSEEKEQHHQYLKTLLEHISVAIVCFTDDYRVQLYNHAATTLFKKQTFSSLKSFRKIDEPLATEIERLKPDQKTLIRVIVGNELLNLSVHSTLFIMGDTRYKIVSFQDIRYELEVKETDSWQKLISVIAHEISNSVIPISTLSRTLCDMITEARSSSHKNETLPEDIERGLRTIETRSAGLVDFVQATKKLRQIPDPEFTKISCNELFSQVSLLIDPIIQNKHITFTTRIDPDDLMLIIDKKLIEQILINLLTNAIEATEKINHPEITLTGWLTADKHTSISVTDNGDGILPENIEKVFMPHFTTKTHGSGIGLSLARRIMHLHRGSIVARSEPGVFTEIVLRF
jgi:two-component system nitrogen regulation sensor histidine kinase NtrY